LALCASLGAHQDDPTINQPKRFSNESLGTIQGKKGHTLAMVSVKQRLYIYIPAPPWCYKRMPFSETIIILVVTSDFCRFLFFGRLALWPER
jgi:hypothetical protein